MKTVLIILFNLWILQTVVAKNNYLSITGIITNEQNQGINKVYIEIISNGKYVQHTYTNYKGKYSLEYVPIKNITILKFYKKNYCFKYVQIDASEMILDDLGEFPMSVNGTMFKIDFLNAYDFLFLGKQPVAKAKYLNRFDNFEWDKNYTAKMKRLITKLRNRLK